MVTAVINVFDRQSKPIKCRTLIDTCSTTNFMTEELAKRLRLPKQPCIVEIGGLCTSTTTTNHTVTATIRSTDGKYERTLNFLTVPQITNLVPDQTVDRSVLKLPKNLKLADPQFHKPAAIDMLLDTSIAFSIMCVGQMNISVTKGTELYLQKTQLGWVIGGKIPTNQPSPIQRCKLSSLNFDIEKFWRIEQVEPTNTDNNETITCENHFKTHVSRDETGRYTVALPFNNKIKELGESRNRALNRFKNLEYKLQRNPDLKKAYTDNLQEYLELGHMTKVVQPTDTGYYLPHHAVVKDSSVTTKVRVVFDGSAETSTGVTLNQALHVGPTIHADLLSLLIRFRLFAFVFSADIEKMYRQIYVRPEDRRYQRIFWRDPATGELGVYEINVVTFGLAPSPFLATRTLHQLAEDEGSNYPLGAQVLKEEMYVDDAVVGTDDRDTAMEKRDQLINILKSGGFNIRQWASNDNYLLKGLPEDKINTQFQLKDSHALKTLGVFWNAKTDTIKYTVKLPDTTERISKRSVLSQIARIFDPLGLLGPVISYAKIFMQKLWNVKLNWDESLPLELHTEWTQYQGQLQQLNQMSFSRHARQPGTQRTELHGFCDASERAFGACIYLRTIDINGQILVTLLCAKSHVAPRGMARSETIPKLELCGAVMLAKLYNIVIDAMKIPIDEIFLWTDATTILHWLHTPTNELIQFVANRVSIITSKTDINDWRHVRSEFNPADALSRGQLPQEFMNNSIWQHGPEWLQQDKTSWPRLDLHFSSDNLVGKKRKTCLHSMTLTDDILNKGASISALESIIAYCLRFKRDNINKGPLKVKEILLAQQVIFRILQRQAFATEMQCIQNGKPLNSNSKILKLKPILDKHGLLRVGGRIKHANISFEQRHQIILPKSHRITTLIITRAHLNNLHSGIQTTLYALRQHYWIVDGRHEVAKVIKACVKCCRFNPQSISYVMGDLPAARVTPSRPFSKVGIDYAGPLFIKERKHRNRSSVKVYVAVFVCLSVKAVHLELVSDLTTEAFIAALKRFIGRRGKCTDIYSDNGTNFVGASNELRDLGQFLINTEHQNKVHEYSARVGINWHFIPARSPNFGGLWEAAVKSFKHHLKRVVGEQLYTFEQLNTFLIEVEAILNSRPLSPISSDPTDLQALTPGHFLIGEPLTSFPQQDLQEIPINRLSTWQHIQRIRQHFWARWHREYLNELTMRNKWTQGEPKIKIGQLVLIKEDNQPPLHWKMGRVIQLHPGADDVIRVVSIRTASGTVKRNVQKLSLLPIEPHPEASTVQDQEDAVPTSD